MCAWGYAVPVAISLIPGCVALARTAGRSAGAWVAAALGGGGWLLALSARIPLLVVVRLPQGLYEYFASFAAGVFEETVRFFLLRAGFTGERSSRVVLSFGIGWGLAEALLVYSIPAALYGFTQTYSWVDLLPGALERNSAIVIHVSLTLLLSRGIGRLSLLAASVLLHSALNSAAVAALHTLRNVWLVELVIAVLSAVVFAVIAVPTLRYLRRTAEPRIGGSGE
ncbi:MAG: YhfC family glutamic-type intramembrane protease [Sulfolobales archaeon]|nr:YhfC family intramembrane metalloprotease [Sulfolobales archaeon]MCX8209213.1 YhfC family intramembrane metalloprotease [Sulfolobales archaeon]MDW8010955.1 YhfC family glutamic-type intramembrane protease [Sulfolobales archaeon]